MKKYFVSLKTYIALMGSLAFGVLNLLVCFIVWGVFYSAFGGELSFWQGMGLTICICMVTAVLNFAFLYFGMRFFMRPIKRVLDVIKAVASGNFAARAIRKLHPRKQEFVYMHELDELIVNINKMSEQLEHHEQLQKQFVSNVSHELKTPIASIAGFSELIQDETTSGTIKNYAEFINNEANRLNKLCSSMLILSRLDGAKIINLSDEIRVDEQLRQVVIWLSASYAGREFELDLQHCTLFSNASLLTQIWQNLIENAIKYSPQNSKIEIYCHDENEECVVVIKDHGIGMSKEQMDKIFERFYQCEESHKALGSGLGLSIVRQILTLLKCEILYESALGDGTKVSVKIPKNSNSQKNTKEHI